MKVIKKYFFTKLNKTLHFGRIKVFFKKNQFWDQSVYFSGHVISQNVEFITLAISQPILKTQTFGLDHKII